MLELFKAVADQWRNEHRGKEDCAKFFVDRGGGLVSSGVEGGYSADGVMACLMFMMRAESPTDLAVLLLHLKVRGSCGDGETDVLSSVGIATKCSNPR